MVSKPDIGREVMRKIMQVTTGLVLFHGARWLHAAHGLRAVQAALLALIGGALLIDYLIARHGAHIPVYFELERPDERHRIHGVTWLLAGMLVAVSVYELDIALAAMVLVFFGDAAAAIAGLLAPRPRIYGRRTLAGSAAMLVAGFLAALAVLGSPGIAAAMAVVGMLAELASTHIDDNMLVPIIAGLAGHLLR